MHSIYIITTEACQMKCPFCYTKFSSGFTDKPVDMDVDLAAKVINKGFISPADNSIEPFDLIIFHGGEPLLRPDIILDIMEKVKVDGIKYAIQTNLDYKELSKKQIEVLVRTGGYGTSYSHDRFLGQNQSELNMVNNIKFLDSIGIYGSLLVTITESQCYNENPWALYKLIHENMPGIMKVMFERPIYSIKEIDANPEKYKKIYDEVDKFMLQALDAFPLNFADIYERIYSCLKFGNTYFPTHCTENDCTLYKNSIKYGCPSIELENNKPISDRKKLSSQCLYCNYYKYCKGDCECMNHICAFPKRTFEKVKFIMKKNGEI